ncbi:hypothetical protein ACOSQ2_007309 [Xanthoceras sorbifolium]
MPLASPPSHAQPAATPATAPALLADLPNSPRAHRPSSYSPSRAQWPSRLVPLAPTAHLPSSPLPLVLTADLPSRQRSLLVRSPSPSLFLA